MLSSSDSPLLGRGTNEMGKWLSGRGTTPSRSIIRYDVSGEYYVWKIKKMCLMSCVDAFKPESLDPAGAGSLTPRPRDNPNDARTYELERPNTQVCFIVF